MTSLELGTPWVWSDSVTSWTWPGHEGDPVTVEVYADADEVALLLDGEEIGRESGGDRLPMLATFETRYQPGTLQAVGYRAGVEPARASLVTAVGPALLTATADRDRVRPLTGAP